MSRTLIIFALVALVFSGASALDTNRYISSKYPDDEKLNSLKAPVAGIVIAGVSLILSFFL